MWSIRSARTIDTSSIISSWRLRISSSFDLLILKSDFGSMTSLTNGPRPNWKKEWMVIAPALTAAIPVGASTMHFFFVWRTTSRRNVVLPVPALPVRNRLISVFSTMNLATFNSKFPLSIFQCPTSYPVPNKVNGFAQIRKGLRSLSHGFPDFCAIFAAA